MKILQTICFLLLSVSWVTAQKTDNDSPNIIFILTDDQSYGYMGCTGNTVVQTPNLDKLAKEGTLFTNAHITSPICMPSRVSILLSQYERKHGVNFNSGTAVAKEAWNESYPMVLRKAGYFTGYVGKNHSPVGKNGYETQLLEKSFDYWYAGHRHLGFYPKDRHKIFKGAKENTQVEVVGEAAIDFLGATSNEFKLDKAIKFLDKRPENKPFCLSICFNLPHGAGTSSMKMKDSDDEIYKTLYRDKDLPLVDNYISKDDIKTPKLPADLLKVENRQTIYDYADKPKTVKETYTRQLQAMTGIDRLVGRLRDKLKEMKVDKKTIIFFSSDHGLMMGQHGLGGKALLYERCTHVPMIIFDPTLPKKKRKQDSGALVQSIDIAATILSKAGVDIPASYQGKDLSVLLERKEDKVRDYVYTENLWSTQFGNPRCEAVQNKEWKYIRYYKNDNFPALAKIKYAKQMGLNVNKMLYGVSDQAIPVYRNFAEGSLSGEAPVYEELYYLSEDANEVNNLAGDVKHANKLAEMRRIWKQEITKARGTGVPKVVRYTNESKMENKQKVGKAKIHD